MSPDHRGIIGVQVTPLGHFTLQCLFLISYIVYKLCDLFMISPHAMFDCDKVLDSSSHYNWLVVWNMFYFSIIGIYNHPN